jgi:hypothetical protein
MALVAASEDDSWPGWPWLLLPLPLLPPLPYTAW